MREPISLSANSARFVNCLLRWFVGACATLVLVASAQQTTPSQPLPRNVWIESELEPLNDWSRHFRLGLLVGLNIKASFSMSGQFDVSGSNPGEPGVSGANHFYDDGYVRVDDTGNALGKTTYWGYTDPLQYDATAQTLTFHSATSFSTDGSATAESSANFGLDLVYGGRICDWGAARIGWEFGFGYLPISLKDNQTLYGRVTRKIHSFTTGGILVPTAPYNGGPSGIGPTIDDVATYKGTDTDENGRIEGSRTLDSRLYVLKLGPSVHWELSPRWAVSLSAGGAFGIVSGDLKYDETVISGNTTGRNQGSVGGSDTTFGAYVGGTVMYHAVKNGDVYLGVQYMPLGSSEIGGGGRQAKLDLSGAVYISAGINWPF